MTQQDIFKNMTKGEWVEMPANTCGIEAYEGDKDVSFLIGSFNKDLPLETQAANNLATIDAVNNTYGKGINPESVEKILITLEVVNKLLDNYGSVESDTAVHILIKESLDGSRIQEALTAAKL